MSKTTGVQVMIRKGEDWGRIESIPVGAVAVHTTAELGRLVQGSRREGASIPPVMLLGGDLMRATGGTGQRSVDSPRATVFPVDLVRVQCGERIGWFASHLVARGPWWRGSWWRGEIVAVVNAQFIGRWDVAPRSHPNDGRIEVIQVASAMPVRERLRARRRLRTGTHVPHPAIEVRSMAASTISLGAPLRLWLDGQAWGRATSITLTVEPDALIACV